MISVKSTKVQAGNHESSDGRAGKGISTIKLHKITYVRVVVASFFVAPSDSLSLSRVVVDPFITLSARFRKTSKSYNCPCARGRGKSLSLLANRAFSRSMKVIARYYSHSTSRTVIRSDVSQELQPFDTYTDRRMRAKNRYRKFYRSVNI